MVMRTGACRIPTRSLKPRGHALLGVGVMPVVVAVMEVEEVVVVVVVEVKEEVVEALCLLLVVLMALATTVVQPHPPPPLCHVPLRYTTKGGLYSMSDWPPDESYG